MHLSLLYFILSFALAIVAIPVKSGSVDEDGSRARCGVVAFQPDGRVWLVDSKKEGYILPKGGYDSYKDGGWEDCVIREAREEAGVVIDRGSIQYLNVDDGATRWFKGTVVSHGARTDPELASRRQPIAVTVEDAWRWLGAGDQRKKAGMRSALHAAT
ncbi:hypothetical protein LX32DRAFT_678405 [Colletotrichum zoysiae]|uniref:Nudix hydrolase domain-containing protein n=1 Tax=Colletotrichum zoysiae TaxID=1216348 RepID=A0AAD9HW57_9PEZI|nr:hypothetical protein LX32DRAFT_678405 [Colletotrichum zoysiae]